MAVSHHCAARVGAAVLAAGEGSRAFAGNAKTVAAVNAARNGSVPLPRTRGSLAPP